MHFLADLSIEQVKQLPPGSVLYLSDEAAKFSAIPEHVIVHLGIGSDLDNLKNLKHIKVFQIDGATSLHLISQIPRTILLQINGRLNQDQIKAIPARHIRLATKKLQEIDFIRFKNKKNIVIIDVAESLDEKYKKPYLELIRKYIDKNKHKAKTTKKRAPVPSELAALLEIATENNSMSDIPQEGNLSSVVESGDHEPLNNEAESWGIGIEAQSETNTNNATREYIAELEQTLEQTQENLSQKTRDFEKLQEEMSAMLESKNSCILTLESTINELNSFVDRLKNEMKNMQESRNENDVEFVALREKILTLERMLFEESAKRDETIQERNELKIKITELEQVEKTSVDLQQAIASKDDKIKKLEERLEQLEKMHEEDKKKIAELTSEIDPLEKDLEHLFKDILPEKMLEVELLKKKKDSLQSDLEKTIKLLQDENALLKTQHDIDKSKVVELESQNKDLIVGLRKKQSLQDSLYQLQQETKAIEEMLKRKSQDCASFERQCVEYLNEVEKLKKDIKDVRHSFNDFQAQNASSIRLSIDQAKNLIHIDRKAKQNNARLREQLNQAKRDKVLATHKTEKTKFMARLAFTNSSIRFFELGKLRTEVSALRVKVKELTPKEPESEKMQRTVESIKAGGMVGRKRSLTKSLD